MFGKSISECLKEFETNERKMIGKKELDESFLGSGSLVHIGIKDKGSLDKNTKVATSILSKYGLNKIVKNSKKSKDKLAGESVLFLDANGNTVAMLQPLNGSDDAMSLTMKKSVYDEYGVKLPDAYDSKGNVDSSKIIENLDEGSDKIQQTIDAVKDMKLVDMRKALEPIFGKKNVDFAMSPVAHFRIKDGNKTLIIVSKKYADDSDKVFGDYAIGYEG